MDSHATDKRQVRRAFEQAAANYDDAAVLQREICDRMLERLDFIRHQPRTILDAGCGTGYGLRRLEQRYPGAALTGLDIALAMLRVSRGAAPWWRPLLPGRAAALLVCAELEALPLRSGWAGLVWSNATLQWVSELPRAFAEVHRVLAAGGLFMFSSFGPDTLKEVRAAFIGDGHTHTNRFTDMHDIGDLLLQGGFANPVMDMEVITLTYDEPLAILRDLKAIGAHNVTAGRARGLTGRKAFSSAMARLEAGRRDGRIPVTFEVVYGHAWKPEPRLGPSGKPVIEIKPERKP
ncbi:MAG TPA: malonyl-ACP O-methyltransferase BioC [Burkholderiales bacterium]|nr:malonyl-ACP O-methyltransferase BioC [Burkholderiales bacterium]